jgi:DNA topoisomerase-2
VYDGLKEALRKILFSLLKKNPKQPIKVAQLAGYTSEHSEYHHGEQNLPASITGFAQSFVGSNNIPLLTGQGQFGTRLEGGKDAASGRYIFARLSPITRYIYRVEDEPVLQWRNVDGTQVEPHYYLPIIPMVLINGANGIGTGWSCSIPCFHPVDVVQYLMAYLTRQKQAKPSLRPWYRGFTGVIEPITDRDEQANKKNNKQNNKQKNKPTENNKFPTFVTRGRMDRITKRGVEKIHILELPVGKWTNKYFDTLKKLKSEKKIADLDTHCTDSTVHFIITPNSDDRIKKQQAKKKQDRKEQRAMAKQKNKKRKLDQLEMNDDADDDADDEQLSTTHKKKHKKTKKSTTQYAQRMVFNEKTLGLETTLDCNNMNLFCDESVVPQHFATPDHIMQVYIGKRLTAYQERRQYQLHQLQRECNLLEQKLLFLKEVMNKKLKVFQQSDEAIVRQLAQRGYKTISKLDVNSDERVDVLPMDEENEQDKSESELNGLAAYRHLLNLPTRSYTDKKLKQLQQQIDTKQEQIQTLQNCSIEQMWLNELQELMQQYYSLYPKDKPLTIQV